MTPAVRQGERTDLRERERGVTLSLDLLQNASALASSYPRRKRHFQSLVTVLQFLLTSNLVKSVRESSMLPSLMQLPNSRSSLSPSLIQSPISRVVLKIPYPRMQKAREDDLLSRILPEFHFQMAELTHKTLHISSSTAQNVRNTINQLKYRIRSCTM